MNLNKPAFWDLKNFIIWPILLLPITFLYSLILFIKRIVSVEKKLNIKVICIGNIYIGGTGKTPLTIKIASLLRGKMKIAVVKKEYSYLQDEILLLKKNCKVFVNKSRRLAIQQAINEGYDLVILDDGFQDMTIKKDLSIICFSSKQGIGNGFTFPSGPLRESLARLKYADMVFINGDLNPELEKKIKLYNKYLEVFYSRYSILDIKKYNSKKYFAFSGIGNNINLLNLLKKNKINVVDHKFFPDHYSYNESDINSLKEKAKKNNLQLLTTEKDFLRLDDVAKKDIEYVNTELIINNEERLMKKIIFYENN